MNNRKVTMEKRAARKSRRKEKVAENADLAGKASNSVPSGDSDANAANGKAPPRHFRSDNGRKGGKRKKSPSMSKLKKQLWSEISLLVRSWSERCAACKVNPTSSAAHIVPSNSGAATRYFLPNLYPVCIGCNYAEYHQRGPWVYKHKEMFGDEYVDALYSMSRETFQIKKDWVIAETERIKKLRGAKN